MSDKQLVIQDRQGFRFVHPGHGDTPTDVHFADVDTPLKILRQVSHMLPKTWVTKDHIDQFIGMALERIGLWSE